MSCIVGHVDHAKDQVVGAVTHAACAIRDGYLWMGRKVEDLTRAIGLPEPIAKIVAASLWALPLTCAVTALSFVLPEIAFLIIVGLPVGLWQAGLGRKMDETIGMEHRQHLYTGIRDVAIIQMGLHTAAMAVTGNWYILLPIVTNLATAVQAGLIALKPTPKAPEPKV